MTPTQRLALQFLDGVLWATPAEIGRAAGGTKRNRAQGLGRLGAGVAKRLRDAGLVEDCPHLNAGFSAHRITGAGRAALRRVGREG